MAEVVVCCKGDCIDAATATIPVAKKVMKFLSADGVSVGEVRVARIGGVLQRKGMGMGVLAVNACSAFHACYDCRRSERTDSACCSSNTAKN